MPSIDEVRRACITATSDLWHGNAAKGIKPDHSAARKIAAVQAEADKPGANADVLAKQLTGVGVSFEKE